MTKVSAISVVSGIINERKTYHPEVVKAALATLNMPYSDSLRTFKEISEESQEIPLPDPRFLPQYSSLSGTPSRFLKNSDDENLMEQ